MYNTRFGRQYFDYYDNNGIEVEDYYTKQRYILCDNTYLNVNGAEFGINENFKFYINKIDNNSFKLTLFNNFNNMSPVYSNFNFNGAKFQIIVNINDFNLKRILLDFIYERNNYIMKNEIPNTYYLPQPPKITENVIPELKTYIEEYIEKIKKETKDYCKDILKI